MKSLMRLLMLAMLVALLGFGLTGCGDDGSNGSDGSNGKSAYEIAVENGFTGTEQEWLDSLDSTSPIAQAAAVEPESCTVCHNGSAEANGDAHQAVYNQYTDASTLTLTIDSLVGGATAADATLTFTISPDTALADLDQKTFYAVAYDPATNKVTGSFSFSTSSPTSLGGGQYSLTTAAATFDVSATDCYAYGYVADGKLSTEGMQLYDNVSNAALVPAGSTVEGDYASTANVAGCVKCHGNPYMKHGYRAAEVTGLPDFVACKACHIDADTNGGSASGGHQDWQLLYDNEELYAKGYLHTTYPTSSHDSVVSHLDEIPADLLTAADTAEITAITNGKYAYTKSVMADVHMSHNMEFAYPQSMANCVVCHEGKLDQILTDANFVFDTCQSCHAVDNLQAKADAALGSHPEVGPATDCSNCHSVGSGWNAKLFGEIHTGYNAAIYDADGNKYADEVTVSIDTLDYDSTTGVLHIEFSADPGVTSVDVTQIVPTVYVAAYGYDTKDFIISNHDRVDGVRIGEFTIGSDDNAYFANGVANSGSWSVDFNLLTAFDANNYVADGVVSRVEVAVAPALTIGDNSIGLDAPSETWNIVGNATVAKSPIVDEAKCNACHEQLATTFHSPNRGGNVVVCRMCHTTMSGGSHLEMQSRSIDSYVHAIHSFQPFDTGDINFNNDVEKVEYLHHIESTYPNFTILNCESCHDAGTFNVPDQAKSLPGKFSAADTWSVDRNIGAVPSYDAGPASRACGSCHRAALINEDEAGDLSALNSHTASFGYLVEDDTSVLDTIIETIMSIFN